jgi:hypothetical protein
MAVRAAALLMTTTLLVAAGEARVDPARSFLMTAFQLSADEIARLDRGDVVARTLEVTHHREVATLGIVRIRTSPPAYVERLADIAAFKRTDDVLQIGTFSNPPRLDDMAALTVDEADLKRLRECRVENCDVRLPADAIERIHREVDWGTPDGPRRGSRLVSELLVDYVARYRQRGAPAAMEYADRSRRLNVGREFASLLDADTITSAYTPRLRQHLLDFPGSSVKGTTDFVYWSKELVRGRPVISITHVATVPAVDDSPVAYAIGSKQIYAMHYFDASLGLTLLVPDRTAADAATYVVYVNRSRIDLFDAPFGGVARRIVAGRARILVAEQLKRLQQVLAK